MTDETYDFHGWATKNNVKCTDGRTILHNAFIENDGGRVPLVWNHKHDSPFDVLGHADLENRDEGVYAHCKFNETDSGQAAKLLVQHHDVNAMSIWANGLKQDSELNVRHGVIREVSLVLAGANPKALIQTVLSHSDDPDYLDEEDMILSLSADGCEMILSHSEDEETKKKKLDEEDAESEEESEDKESEDEAEATAAEAEEEQNEDLKKKKKDEALEHSGLPDKKGKEEKTMAENKDLEKDTEEKPGNDKTVKEVFDSMTDDQKIVLYYMIGEAIKEKGGPDEDNEDEGGKNMKHNVFDQEEQYEDTYLSHEDMDKIFTDAKRCGSLKEAVEANIDGGVLAHSIDTTGMTTATGVQTYGFNDTSMLFPEFRSTSAQPEWISRNTDWVPKVLGGVHRTPFSRIKSVFANITEDEARAKGYIKGNQKKDEVFSTLKRTTQPQTIYKKQKLDRDDIIDITDFDIVAWIRAEMRIMLNEELARSFLIGDGRSPVSDEKIKEDCIRPIATDVPLFNTQVRVSVENTADDETVAKATIKAAIRARKFYKGSGTPTLFTSEDWLTEMLLLEDGIGHKLYKTEQELATALRVKEIVTVEPMTGHTLNINSKDYPLIGIIVNLADYNVGADKGGAINMFDDFDIDYNQQKYLIETRCSGALVKPFSALTLYLDRASA